MKQTRFVLGLALLASAIVVFQLITEPFLATGQFTQYGFWWLLGSGIGGVAGALVWGIIVWLPLRIIRGAKNAPDPLKVSLYTAAIVVGAFIVFRLVVSPTMTERERHVFVSEAQKSCFSTQRSSAVNATLTDAQLREYCSCVALSLSELITKKEVRYLWANKSVSPSAQGKVNKVAEECRRELSTR